MLGLGTGGGAALVWSVTSRYGRGHGPEKLAGSHVALSPEELFSRDPSVSFLSSFGIFFFACKFLSHIMSLFSPSPQGCKEKLNYMHSFLKQFSVWYGDRWRDGEGMQGPGACLAVAGGMACRDGSGWRMREYPQAMLERRRRGWAG